MPSSTEYIAAHDAVVLADEGNDDVLRVTGKERASFLHGMVTNDVLGLAVGESCYAAMLTPKGAMVGDMRILKRSDDMVLCTGKAQGMALKEFLNKFLISEDAEIHDASELAILHVLGPQAETLLARWPDDAVLGRFQSPLRGVDVLVARQGMDALYAQAVGVPRLSAETREVLRVEAGVPLFGIDMTSATIPLEANLSLALSYNKGCYIGQEVIARATYRGQVNKKLMGLLLGDSTPAVGTALKQGDTKVGWLTSIVRSQALGQVIALGYVQRNYWTPGTQLQVASGGIALVTSLPFVTV